MLGYNPFNKELSELSIDDLVILKSASEGWYIEYKRELSSVESAAKSLSAFANTYGGWLFYGIDESQNQDRTAGSFPGVDISNLPQLEEWLQQAASTCVNPEPYFLSKAFSGPNEALGLPAGRAILLVWIPQGSAAPYVHSSGRIFRRVADASTPKPETDRHFLDLLWERGKIRQKEFSKYISRTPTVSKSEKDNSFIRMFFFTDPWKQKGHRSQLEFEEFAKLMQSAAVESGGIPFDNIFPSSTGFVARQTANNRHNLQLFTWKYSRLCTSEIILPLNGGYFNNLEGMGDFLHGYEQADKFLSLCRKANIDSGRIIELTQLFSILCGITKRQIALMNIDGRVLPIYFKVQLVNVWRRMPFLDMKEVMAYYDKYGIPLTQDNKCFAPPGKSPNHCMELSENLELGKESEPTLFAAMILSIIAQALGIPHHIFEMGNTLADMIEMGERARRITKNRS